MKLKKYGWDRQFKDLSDFLDSKPNAFSIARFFNVEKEIVTEWDIKNFFRNFNKDINRLFKRKMIRMIVDKTTDKEILISKRSLSKNVYAAL